MAYSRPRMPIQCDIYDNVGTVPPTAAPRVANVNCQLRFLRSQFAQLADNGRGVSTMLLLVNPGTDIRMTWGFNLPDLVEVPSGTGRWYVVNAVDDVAKGFPNEYRAASISSTNFTIATWIPPYA